MSTTRGDHRIWWLSPRDPLVFGNGAEPPALVPRPGFSMPPQSTVAGLVRSSYVEEPGRFDAKQAAELLKIHIRGPWLMEGIDIDGSSIEPDPWPHPWVPIPTDVRVARAEQDQGTYQRSCLLRLRKDEGTYGNPCLGLKKPLFVLPKGKVEGVKTVTPRFHSWRLEDWLRWNLEEVEDEEGLTCVYESPDFKPPVDHESRIHVGLEKQTYTASPEVLFSSGGMRFDDVRGMGLAVEVIDHRDQVSSPGLEGQPRLVVLGAESRSARLQIAERGLFPGFDRYRDRYAKRIEKLAGTGLPLGLRLQLITAGCFGGWQPVWEKGLEDRLCAVAMDRFQAVSGWNLNARKPRAVRRLVPPGSFYVLAPFAADELLQHCKDFWARALRSRLEESDEKLLAAPDADGYGLVLPVPCSVPKSKCEEER